MRQCFRLLLQRLPEQRHSLRAYPARTLESCLRALHVSISWQASHYGPCFRLQAGVHDKKAADAVERDKVRACRVA